MHRREFLSICAVFLAGCGGAAQTQSPTQSPVPTESVTQPRTPSPTSSATESPTESPTASPTESPTRSPTESPTPSPTESPTPTDSPTPSPTPDPREEVEFSASASSDEKTVTVEVTNYNHYEVKVWVRFAWDFTDGADEELTTYRWVDPNEILRFSVSTDHDASVVDWEAELAEVIRS